MKVKFQPRIEKKIFEEELLVNLLMLTGLIRTFLIDMNRPIAVVVVVVLAAAVIGVVDGVANVKAETSTETTKALVDTLDCDPASDLCWPKCCLANQVFDLTKFSCNHVEDTSLLLLKPEIHSLR